MLFYVHAHGGGATVSTDSSGKTTVHIPAKKKYAVHKSAKSSKGKQAQQDSQVYVTSEGDFISGVKEISVSKDVLTGVQTQTHVAKLVDPKTGKKTGKSKVIYKETIVPKIQVQDEKTGVWREPKKGELVVPKDTRRIVSWTATQQPILDVPVGQKPSRRGADDYLRKEGVWGAGEVVKRELSRSPLERVSFSIINPIAWAGEQVGRLSGAASLAVHGLPDMFHAVPSQETSQKMTVSPMSINPYGAIDQALGNQERELRKFSIVDPSSLFGKGFEAERLGVKVSTPRTKAESFISLGGLAGTIGGAAISPVVFAGVSKVYYSAKSASIEKAQEILLKVKQKKLFFEGRPDTLGVTSFKKGSPDINVDVNKGLFGRHSVQRTETRTLLGKPKATWEMGGDIGAVKSGVIEKTIGGGKATTARGDFFSLHVGSEKVKVGAYAMRSPGKPSQIGLFHTEEVLKQGSSTVFRTQSFGVSKDFLLGVKGDVSSKILLPGGVKSAGSGLVQLTRFDGSSVIPFAESAVAEKTILAGGFAAGTGLISSSKVVLSSAVMPAGVSSSKVVSGALLTSPVSKSSKVVLSSVVVPAQIGSSAVMLASPVPKYSKVILEDVQAVSQTKSDLTGFGVSVGGQVKQIGGKKLPVFDVVPATSIVPVVDSKLAPSFSPGTPSPALIERSLQDTGFRLDVGVLPVVRPVQESKQIVSHPPPEPHFSLTDMGFPPGGGLVPVPPPLPFNFDLPGGPGDGRSRGRSSRHTKTGYLPSLSAIFFDLKEKDVLDLPRGLGVRPLKGVKF